MLGLRLTDLGASLTALFFPQTCTFCNSNDALDRKVGLCRECYEKLRPVPEPICACCGQTLQVDTGPHVELCGGCLANPPAYDRARFGYSYENELRETLVNFKYYQRLDAIRTLSELTIRAFHRYFDRHGIDLIVPVPLSKNRLRSRGFNQSALLARWLSDHTGIPIDYTSFRKIKDTKPQARLTREQRKVNLRGSFGLANHELIKGRSILLFDDVSTTQSTIGEAARTLKKAKAVRVDCLVLALTLSPFMTAATHVQNSEEEANY